MDGWMDGCREGKTAILQLYNVSRRGKTEVEAACYSALSASSLFISGWIFPLQILTFYLLNTTCVED